MSGLAIEQMPDFAVMSLAYEARRICDERGITDLESYDRICAALRHREFKRCIEPYMKLKTSVFVMRMVDKITMDADGSNMRVEYKPFTEETQRNLDQLEEAIQAEAKRWGFNAAP